MGRGLREAMTLAALTLLVGACTVEDVKDTRAADSAAAATGKALPPAANATQGTAAAGTGASTAVASGAMAGSGAAPTAASASDSAGNLAPDSVDVGRRNKANLLPLSRLHLEVDLESKQLTALDGDQSIAMYPVAIGSPQWPTQAGQWEVKQVVWNPEWIPPKDEAWAEAKDPKSPGAPDNPLGRAQLVYDPPRTIHGTNEPQSIGKAVSHGSIRLANADVVKIARQLMEATGVQKDDAWYRQVQQNRTEKVPVDLPQRVPIRVF